MRGLHVASGCFTSILLALFVIASGWLTQILLAYILFFAIASGWLTSILLALSVIASGGLR